MTNRSGIKTQDPVSLNMFDYKLLIRDFCFQIVQNCLTLRFNNDSWCNNLLLTYHLNNITSVLIEYSLLGLLHLGGHTAATCEERGCSQVSAANCDRWSICMRSDIQMQRGRTAAVIMYTRSTDRALVFHRNPQKLYCFM